MMASNLFSGTAVEATVREDSVVDVDITVAAVVSKAMVTVAVVAAVHEALVEVDTTATPLRSRHRGRRASTADPKSVIGEVRWVYARILTIFASTVHM